MIASTDQQLDLHYRGRDIRIQTSATQAGWHWTAFVDSRPALECEDDALPSAELALESGIAAAEDLIDAGDDYSTRTSSPARIA